MDSILEVWFEFEKMLTLFSRVIFMSLIFCYFWNSIALKGYVPPPAEVEILLNADVLDAALTAVLGLFYLNGIVPFFLLSKTTLVGDPVYNGILPSPPN